MPERTRRLAAIVFTDVVGFTSAMGEDEARALGLLERKRRILKPLVRRYGGVWLKELGDGCLLSFPSAVNAVD